MKLIQTPIAVAVASDCDDIYDARLDAVARKIVALVEKAGWDRNRAIQHLISELSDVVADMDFAALSPAQRRPYEE